MIEKIKENYQVIDSDEVIVSIVIGEEQAGWTAIFLNGKYETEGQTKIENYSLGKGSQLKSGILKINTTVIDKNPRTNRTAVTYFLTGGSSAKTITSKLIVENDNDPALYDAEFTFV